MLAVALQNAGVAAGPVNAAPDFLDDPHLLEREYWVDQALADQPSLRYPGLAIRFNEQPPRHGSVAPKLGEHNAEVLKEWLGASDTEIADLENRGVLLNRPPPSA